MIYRLPEISDKESLYDYIQEHYDNGEVRIRARFLSSILILGLKINPA